MSRTATRSKLSAKLVLVPVEEEDMCTAEEPSPGSLSSATTIDLKIDRAPTPGPGAPAARPGIVTPHPNKIAKSSEYSHWAETDNSKFLNRMILKFRKLDQQEMFVT